MLEAACKIMERRSRLQFYTLNLTVKKLILRLASYLEFYLFFLLYV